ncbi:MAG: hypothetical protein AB1Z22_09060 [Synechococcaceae cyanobacterium]
MPADRSIANTVGDLIQGDVLGQGTTTSLDNGELTFVQPGDGSGHFLHECFSGHAISVRTPVALAALGPTPGTPLQELVSTVASKLCIGQQRRNTAIARSAASEATVGQSIHQSLHHFRLTPSDPSEPADPIRYLGSSLQGGCCGFHDNSEPHLQGCSTDLRYGGRLHQEHAESRLAQIERLVDQLGYGEDAAHIRMYNRGAFDVSDVGVAVVIADPQLEIQERPELQGNNRLALEVEL